MVKYNKLNITYLCVLNRVSNKNDFLTSAATRFKPVRSPLSASHKQQPVALLAVGKLETVEVQRG